MIKKVTVKTLKKYKDTNEKFSMLTSYDYSTAKYIDEAGIDVILVGDSAAMVVLGYENTNNIGIDEMALFTKAVSTGAKRALIVADMAFMSFTDISEGLKNAGRLIKSGANAVKIEGCSDYILELVKRCTELGIPVMAHLGFTPQSQNVLGGFVIQSKNFEATLNLLEQAKKLEQAGAFAVVLEMVPEESAKFVTENLNIPTVSCGGGRYCTGQVVVVDDMLGKFSDFKPKFVRRYGDLKSYITDCATKYHNDIKSGSFPSDEEVYHLTDDEAKQLNIHCNALQLH